MGWYILEDDRIGAFVKELSVHGVEALNSRLVKEIEIFKGTQSYPDDITIVTCKIKERNEE